MLFQNGDIYGTVLSSFSIALGTFIIDVLVLLPKIRESRVDALIVSATNIGREVRQLSVVKN
jgi:hypothetical protein